jgi:flagellar basal-body rod protein FlgG
MLRAFSTAATGMTAQQLMVDNIANNIANINTAGFKRSQLDFQDLMYVKLQEPDEKSPSGMEVGGGVRPASTLKVFTQGEMENTGRTLDLAIQGDGFFQITGPGGKTFYTRDGTFRINSNGAIVTASGYFLDPAISVPADARSIGIASDGTVTAYVGSGSSPSKLGTITLARFSNPSGLTNEGGNLLSETVASGTATTGIAAQDGLGAIQQGFLERSNVQMVTELVNMINAQRAYETNSRAIRAGDEMLSTANRLIS